MTYCFLHQNLCLCQNWDVPKVLIMTQELLPFILSICISGYYTQLFWACTMPFVVSIERGGGHICFSRAVIRIMLISFVLMFSSVLACNQYFISSTAVIKDTSQFSSLQHNKRIHPDLESLFFHLPFLIVFGFSLVFKHDANDTSRNHPGHLGEGKQISRLNEMVWKSFYLCCGFCKKIMLPQTGKLEFKILCKPGNSFSVTKDVSSIA